MVFFGQVVVGPPGAGKSTYCRAMQEFLKGVGRSVSIINLDPAVDGIPYDCSVDISTLITISDVMKSLNLGPNGSLIYCMEYLEKNSDWLIEQIQSLKGHYLLFDCPGQVELYTHHCTLQNTLELLTKRLDLRLAAVHLIESHYCSDPSKFIAATLTSLSAMLRLGLPHVNILSKADLIESAGPLAFNLDYYTEVMDLSHLLEHLTDEPFFAKYRRLNKAIVGVVEDYSLVSFVPCYVQDKQSMLRVVKVADRSNGYVFGDLEERNIQSLLSCAVGAEFE